MPKFVHVDISADEPERAAGFYRTVFGWDVTRMEGPVPYWLISTDPADPSAIGAGIGKREQPWQTAAPMIEVASVDDYVARIEASGGSILTPKELVPTVGYIAVFKDTEGNVLALLEPVPG